MWYMIIKSSIEIDASAGTVWAVFVDVERWSTWTASITRIVALDGSGIEVGKRFEIKQPHLPKLVWEVTDVDRGRSWTWRQRSFGATTSARHQVIPIDNSRTLASQSIDQRGPIGVLAGRLTRKLTKRYLGLEAHGLKRRSEDQPEQSH
jgi:hypothetical protein